MPKRRCHDEAPAHRKIKITNTQARGTATAIRARPAAAAAPVAAAKHSRLRRLPPSNASKANRDNVTRATHTGSVKAKDAEWASTDVPHNSPAQAVRNKLAPRSRTHNATTPTVRPNANALTQVAAQSNGKPTTRPSASSMG